ncbi:MAG: glycosyltransferase family 39 protein [Candidatus Binataceae bacterium]
MIAAITSVGAALRLHRLGAQSFWTDESLTAWISSTPWSVFIATVTQREANMSVYFLLARWWMVLGDSEAFLRLPSALASIATVPLLYLLARQMFSERVAIGSAALVAVHSGALRYAQEARGYSMLVLLVVLSWIFLLRVMERPSFGNCVVYVVVSVLGVYTHFFGALGLLAQATALLAVRDERTPWRKLLGCAGAIAILLLPIAYFVISRDVGQIGWAALMRRHALARTISALFGIAPGNYRTPMGLATLAAYTAALSLSAIAWIRAAREWGREFLMYTLAWAGLTVPLLVAVGVSLAKDVLIPRYLSECAPFAVMLVAAGVGYFDRRRAGAVAIAALIGIGLFWDATYFASVRKDDWRGATAFVVANSKAGDALAIYHPLNLAGFEYYRRHLAVDQTRPQVIYPDEHSCPTIGNEGSWEASEVRNRASLFDAIDAIDVDHPRLWVLLTTVPLGSVNAELETAIEHHLAKRFHTKSETQFKGIKVWLYG